MNIISEFQKTPKINKGIWFHEHKGYIHIYGENKIECEKFKELLKNEKIIT